MKKAIFAMALGFAILGSGAAMAADAGLQNAAMTNANNQVSCRLNYHEGQVVRHVTCMTNAQWQFINYLTEQQVRDWQNHGLIQSGR